jgi:hypothetical protein
VVEARGRGGVAAPEHFGALDTRCHVESAARGDVRTAQRGVSAARQCELGSVSARSDVKDQITHLPASGPLFEVMKSSFATSTVCLFTAARVRRYRTGGWVGGLTQAPVRVGQSCMGGWAGRGAATSASQVSTDHRG